MYVLLVFGPNPSMHLNRNYFHLIPAIQRWSASMSVDTTKLRECLWCKAAASGEGQQSNSVCKGGAGGLHQAMCIQRTPYL